jgi:DNA invertase Pin-like site-specific DNA recombinase
VTLLAAYLRDSGGDRQENSTDRQLAEIQSWALRSGHTLAHVFTDSARPGSSTVGRDAFQEMIHLFRSPACTLDGLVIWSWSRFARDINDAQFFRADLRRRGFEIYSVSDPIPDGPMGRFIEAAIDWKNQQFLADLSKDVKSGLATLVREHGAVPGTPRVASSASPSTLAATAPAVSASPTAGSPTPISSPSSARPGP